MELHFSEINTPPTPSATIVLLRGGQSGLEVLLQKRHSKMAVLGGAYVFPGGKVAESDHEPALHGLLDTPADLLTTRLGQPDIATPTSTAFYIAGLRELLEESTIWLGRSPGNLPAADGFNQWVAQHQLTLPVGALVPWSRWITPKLASVTRQRFDTVFFVAHMPSHQEALHDHHEATDSLWVSPRQALTQYWQGEVELAPPQIMTLAHLAQYAHPQAAIDAARQRTAFLVEPQPQDVNGTRWLCYPGDRAHSVAKRHMPGPSRLAWRGQRFEPEGGFEAFFKAAD